MTQDREKRKEMRAFKNHVYHKVSSHRHWEGEYGKRPSQLVNAKGQRGVDDWLRYVLAGYGGGETKSAVGEGSERTRWKHDDDFHYGGRPRGRDWSGGVWSTISTHHIRCWLKPNSQYQN